MKLSIRFFSFVAGVILIGGCAVKTKLIITPLVTTESKLTKILKEFENDGFELTVNRKYDIETYTHNVIAHSPDTRSYMKAVEIRDKLLKSQLLDYIELRVFNNQNHYFSKNSIGLFIVEMSGDSLVDSEREYFPWDTVAYLKGKKTTHLLGHMYTNYDCDFSSDLTFVFQSDKSFVMRGRSFGSADKKQYGGRWGYNVETEQIKINYNAGTELSFFPVVQRFWSNDGWELRRSLKFIYSSDETLTSSCDVFLLQEE